MDRRLAIKKTGALFGTALTTSFLHSCVWEKKETLSWVPQFLEHKHALMAKQITHVLIPDPEVPENIKNTIPQRLDVILQEYTQKDAQNSFIEGMVEMEKRSLEFIGKEFSNANLEEKTRFLKEEEKKFVASDTPTFYGDLKQMIFETFFQTEYAVTQLLYFDALPGGYDGCVPFEEIGRIQHSNDIY